MSRIGKLPIAIPKGVTLVVDDNLVSIKGPLGELNRQIPPEIHVDIKEDQAFFQLMMIQNGHVHYMV
jgi:large subunit ribosomal protein L6